VLALIGDEIPHEASFPANKDKVDWNMELARLADQGVRCFGIQCLNNSRATYFYKALAERTDGLWLPMKDLHIMKDVFMAVCLHAADTKAFDQFRSQLAASGPVSCALIPLMTRLAKKKKLSNEELTALCGIVTQLASKHGQPPKEVFLPINSVEISVRVEAGACEVELVQSFTNRDALAGQGKSFEYRFALPPSAAVFHFEAHLSSGRIIRGTVKAREEARKEYQRAISKGKTAFLMEEKNADIFSMELGNLEEGETVQIVLKYTTEAEDIGGTISRLRLPQHVAPRSGGQAVNGMLACYPITVHITTSPTSGMCGLKSINYSSRFELHGDTTNASMSGSLKLKPEDGFLNDDLVFDMEMVEEVGDVSIRCEHCDQSGSMMVQVALRPQAREKQPQTIKVALVLDGSCSMQGTAFQQAKTAAAQILSHLSVACPASSCVCFLMQNQVSTICNERPALEAKAAVERWQGQCGGGTNFDAALDEVWSMDRKADAVLLVSDGHGPENLQQLFAKVFGKEKDDLIRVFCCGVGADPGLELLEGLAEITGGVCEVVFSELEIQSAAQRLASAVVSAPTEVKFALANAGECEQWPSKVVAYPGRRTVAYVHTFKKVGEDAEHTLGVTINGRFQSIPAQRVAHNQSLHRLGARKRIAELERLNVDGARDDAICKLALQYGLTSSQTSFVAIDEASDIKAGELNTPVSSEPCANREDATKGWGSSTGEREDATMGWGSCTEERVCEVSDSCLLDLDDCAESCRSSPRSSPRSRDRACCKKMKKSTVDFGYLGTRRGSCATPKGKSSGLTYGAVGARPGSGSKLEEKSSGSPFSLSQSVSRAVSQLASFGGRPKAKEASRDPLLGPVSQVPVMDAALQGKHSYFKGTIYHTSFGPKELSLKLMLDKVEGDQYLGRWVVMGHAEKIALTFDPAVGAVTIRVQGPKLTVLQGKLDSKMGSISGEVIQAGVSGGRFHLEPGVAQVELTDTDGDHLVFVRLLGGGVAEYCNGELVMAALRGLSINKHSGLCDDGEGSFTCPPESRSATLGDLETFLRQESVAITLTK